MPYVQGQTIHDADSHIMEAPDFLDGYVEPAYRDRVDVRKWFGGPTNLLRDSMDSLRRRHDDPGWRAESAEKIMMICPTKTQSGDRPWSDFSARLSSAALVVDSAKNRSSRVASGPMIARPPVSW